MHRHNHNWDLAQKASTNTSPSILSSPVSLTHTTHIHSNTITPWIQFLSHTQTSELKGIVPFLPISNTIMHEDVRMQKYCLCWIQLNIKYLIRSVIGYIFLSALFFFFPLCLPVFLWQSSFPQNTVTWCRNACWTEKQNILPMSMCKLITIFIFVLLVISISVSIQTRLSSYIINVLPWNKNSVMIYSLSCCFFFCRAQQKNTDCCVFSIQ